MTITPDNHRRHAAEVETALPRLVEVSVEGLLDAFDHTIVFPPEWEFVIIFGPNGVGKTRFLELIRDAAALDRERLLDTPFEVLTITFDDGTLLRFSKKDVDLSLPFPSDDDEDGSRPEENPNCVVTLHRPDSPAVHHVLTTPWDEPFERWVEATTTWNRMDRSLWRDSTDGELASIGELHRRYAHVSPQTRARTRRQRPQKMNPELSRFASRLSVRLIETQRLLTMGMRRAREPWEDESPVSYSQTVTQHSDHLREQLSQTVAAHSRLSQQLDRTFPKRILDQQQPTETAVSVRQKYQEQNKLRARLAAFSLIEAEGEVALPSTRNLNEFAITALATYLNDTERKLEVFTDLLERLELFVEIMNARLVRKTVSIDVNKGITVRRDLDGPVIPTGSLSSGEQHEMVLLYDLLFRTDQNSIVLIDEPEISLHVAWQTEFLRDIMRISRISTLRFVIATHSPQIIDEWWSRTNELAVQ